MTLLARWCWNEQDSTSCLLDDQPWLKSSQASLLVCEHLFSRFVDPEESQWISFPSGLRCSSMTAFRPFRRIRKDRHPQSASQVHCVMTLSQHVRSEMDRQQEDHFVTSHTQITHTTRSSVERPRQGREIRDAVLTPSVFNFRQNFVHQLQYSTVQVTYLTRLGLQTTIGRTSTTSHNVFPGKPIWSTFQVTGVLTALANLKRQIRCVLLARSSCPISASSSWTHWCLGPVDSRAKNCPIPNEHHFGSAGILTHDEL